MKNLGVLAEREYRAHTLWKLQHRGWLICLDPQPSRPLKIYGSGEGKRPFLRTLSQASKRPRKTRKDLRNLKRHAPAPPNSSVAAMEIRIGQASMPLQISFRVFRVFCGQVSTHSTMCFRYSLTDGWHCRHSCPGVCSVGKRGCSSLHFETL